MFIIVPKRGQRGAARAPAPGPENTAAVSVSQGDAVTSTATATATSTGTAPPAQVGDKKNADVHDSDAGPVRSTTACDACRVRKTKCNGQEPCARCRARQIICVYSRSSANRNLPASASQVALLQHQQRRLYAAVQNMAAVIARQEGRSDQPPESFNVPELLQKYAPEHTVQDPSGDVHPESAGEKRAPDETSYSLPPPKRAHQEENNALSGDLSPAFDLLPAPDARNASAEQWSDSYQALMQFVESMNARTGSNGTGTRPLMDPLDSSDTGQFAASDSNGQTQRFLDLVDWDASMQMFQDSYDPSSLDDLTFPP